MLMMLVVWTPPLRPMDAESPVRNREDVGQRRGRDERVVGRWRRFSTEKGGRRGRPISVKEWEKGCKLPDIQCCVLKQVVGQWPVEPGCTPTSLKSGADRVKH